MVLSYLVIAGEHLKCVNLFLSDLTTYAGHLINKPQRGKERVRVASR